MTNKPMTQQPNERLLPCPIDAGKAEWREHPYRGTGASGMEAPDLSIRCTVCGLETARERTEQWERGKGTYSIREEAEAKLLARWNTRVPAVQDEGMVAEFLEELDGWEQAYPLSAFPEPDLAKAAELLKAGGMTLDAISASNMRHVVSKIAPKARAAIESLQAAEVERLRFERDDARKALFQMRDMLIAVHDGLEDEGDRVYLGSSNHAELIHEAWHYADAIKWDAFLEGDPAAKEQTR